MKSKEFLIKVPNTKAKQKVGVNGLKTKRLKGLSKKVWRHVTNQVHGISKGKTKTKRATDSKENWVIE